MKINKDIRDAVEAHTNLNTFACVQALLEGGMIYGHNAAANKIIAICKKEIIRQLNIYDAAIESAKRGG